MIIYNIRKRFVCKNGVKQRMSEVTDRNVASGNFFVLAVLKKCYNMNICMKNVA